MQRAIPGPGRPPRRAAAGPARASRPRFWLLNCVANPLVRRILRSPFHGVLSGAVLLLTYQGRRRGRRYTLPVQYARDGDTLYIVPGQAAHKTWWRNLRGGAPVQLHLRGQILAGTAEVISGRNDPGAVADGLAHYLRRFPRAAGMLRVRVPNDGPPDDVAVAAPRATPTARDDAHRVGVLRRVGASRAGVWLVKHVMSPLDRALYRWTGGRGFSLGRPLGPRLLLTTTGRRTGRARTTPVFYLRDGERLIICNVNPGFERPNPWTVNLRAQPVARVQVGHWLGTYRARVATDDEVARYWPRLVRLWPAYQTHFDRSGQRTVFILERAHRADHEHPRVHLDETSVMRG